MRDYLINGIIDLEQIVLFFKNPAIPVVIDLLQGTVNTAQVPDLSG